MPIFPLFRSKCRNRDGCHITDGVLRGFIDRARREGRGAGRYLLLGSAALDLLRQSDETLAGRLRFLELKLDLFLLQQPLFQNFSDIAGAVNDAEYKHIRFGNLVNYPKFVLDDLAVFKMRGS